MIYHLGFIILCLILDSILCIFFPADFAASQFVFVPCMGFAALMLSIKNIDYKDALIYSFLIGAFVDFTSGNSFLLCAFVYTFSAFLAIIWSRHMTSTLLEQLLLCLTTIFVSQVLIYFIARSGGLTGMSPMVWLQKRCFITIVGNIVPVLAVLFLNDLKLTVMTSKELRRRKGERLSWEQLK